MFANLQATVALLIKYKSLEQQSEHFSEISHFRLLNVWILNGLVLNSCMKRDWVGEMCMHVKCRSKGPYIIHNEHPTHIFLVLGFLWFSLIQS